MKKKDRPQNPQSNVASTVLAPAPTIRVSREQQEEARKLRQDYESSLRKDIMEKMVLLTEGDLDAIWFRKKLLCGIYTCVVCV